MRLLANARARVFPRALALAAMGIALVVALTLPLGARPDAPFPGSPLAPEIEGGVKWLNSPPVTLEKLRGKVVLIDFWEYTCVNCLRTFPYLKEWWKRYRDKGLVILGVHTPEFEFAKASEAVERAVREFGLEYPVVLDSNYAIWRAFGNRFWPAKYLIDREGRVRYYHFGEGAYGNTEREIQELLREVNPRVELPKIMEPVRAEDGLGRVCYPVTPELYGGYLRGAAAGTLGNLEGYRPEKVVRYRDPGNHEDGLLYAHGPWRATGEALVSTRQSPYPRDSIALKYHALEVNSVMKPESGKPVRVWVYQDARPVRAGDRGRDLRADSRGRTYVVVGEGRMFNLIKNAEFGQHELRLSTSQAGLGIYSFTFTSCVIARTP